MVNKNIYSLLLLFVLSSAICGQALATEISTEVPIYEKVTTAPQSWAGDYLIVYEKSATEAYVFNADLVASSSGINVNNNYLTENIYDGIILSSTSVDDALWCITLASTGKYDVLAKKQNKYIYCPTGNTTITVVSNKPSASSFWHEWNNNGFRCNNNNSATHYLRLYSYGNQPEKFIYCVHNESYTNNVVFYKRITNHTLTVGPTGYATYHNSAAAYTMPTGMEGYVAYWEDGFQFTKQYDAGDVVPAGVALVLKADLGDYNLQFTTGGTTPSKNDLLGTNTYRTLTEENDYYFYALSLDSNGANVGFYWMNENGDAFNNGAHKAYLRIAKSHYPSQAPEQIIIPTDNPIVTDMDNHTEIHQISKRLVGNRLLIQRDGKTFDITGREIH